MITDTELERLERLVAPGNITLRMLISSVRELKAENKRLKEIIADAYQVVGNLASVAGLFEHSEVIRALDYLAYEESRKVPLLPWPRVNLPNARAEAAEAEVERLRKALEPFVKEFEDRRDAYIRRYPRHPAVGAANFDKMPDHWPMDSSNFTMGTFRAARAALGGQHD